jgi:hypothetical protein
MADQEVDCKQLKRPVKLSSSCLRGLSAAKADHAKNVIESPEFSSASTFRDQVVILVKAFHADDKNPELNFRELAEIMGIPNAQSLRHQWNQSQDVKRPDGRTPIITDAAHDYILQVVNNRFERRDPIALHELGELLLEEMQIAITNDTL